VLHCGGDAFAPYHALLEVRNHEDGTFELVALNTTYGSSQAGNATVTVKVVALERDVDVWVTESTFAVSVGNNAPTRTNKAVLANSNAKRATNNHQEGGQLAYIATTNNHALLTIQNADEDAGTFHLTATAHKYGAATITVKAVAVGRF
jgi:hypothetical protein